MNKCKEISSLLSPYLDGELGSDESAEVKEHLEKCRACQEELEMYGMLGKALRESLASQVARADFEGFSGRVLAGLRQGDVRGLGHVASGGRKRDGSWAREHYKVILALAAIILLVVGLLLVPNLFDATGLGKDEVVVKLVDPPKGYDAVVYPPEGDNVTVIWMKPADMPSGHDTGDRGPSL